MIDFEITNNGQTRYVTWAKLCQFAGMKPYQPGTPELASIKTQLAKQWDLEPDNVIVRMNRQPIL
tara:strand:- start:644 stop:838 length:195 start_codon:yes stop_codon:yes gene_type:complete